MRRAALLSLPFLLLTACGSEESDSVDQAAPLSPSEPAVGELDPTACLDDPEFLEENAEFCYGGGYVEPELETIEIGTAYELTDLEDPASRETMTVQGVECGLTELEDGASNPAWDGSDEISQTTSAAADPGMEFCRITGTWQNTGQKPIVGWNDFQNLVTEDGTEYAEDEKASEATQYINSYGMPSGCSPYTCSTINPGSPAFDIVKIYQVPEGTEPVAVQWPNATLMGGPTVQFALS